MWTYVCVCVCVHVCVCFVVCASVHVSMLCLLLGMFRRALCIHVYIIYSYI